MKNPTLVQVLVLAGVIIGLGYPAIPAQAQGLEKVQELQRVIEAQQKQLEALQKQLDAQGKLLQDLAAQRESPTEETRTTVQAPVEKVVTSGEERVKLSVSGWVNRAVNVVDDGKDTDAFFVDNDNAESRVNFVGTGKINNDLTLVSRIELSIAPDKAGYVNQNTQEAGDKAGDTFEQRWTEVSLESKRFGKLSLGKGFTASYGSAAGDLSQTGVIAYATVADTAGGMLFRQTGDDTLTDLDVTHAFQSFDGLNRRSRVRYDTPTYQGFQLSTSLITDQRYDAALRWGGKAMASRLSRAGLLLIRNRKTQTCNTLPPFLYCMRKPG